jgi:hypothetical protein
MAASQSQFSRLPKKTLYRIAEQLIDSNFSTDNPYDDYDENLKTLETIGKYFNMGIVDEDVQFFAKFLYINDGIIAKIMEKSDILSYEDLVIPTAKTYNMDYDIWGTCSYTDYKVAEIDSYDIDWVHDTVQQQYDDGNFFLYDGKDRYPTQYDNFEDSDHQFGDVYESKVNVKESLLDRLVLENTSDVVSSLDKQTLLKLKQIIESRLRSL